jgi:hypothetical protein
MENTLFLDKKHVRSSFLILSFLFLILILLVFSHFTVSYIFPAIGLAAVAAKALTITDEDYIVAAKTLAEFVPQPKLKDGCCYPELKDIRSDSHRIAVAVAKHIVKTGRSDRKDVEGYSDFDWFQLCRRET